MRIDLWTNYFDNGGKKCEGKYIKSIFCTLFFIPFLKFLLPTLINASISTISGKSPPSHFTILIKLLAYCVEFSFGS